MKILKSFIATATAASIAISIPVIANAGSFDCTQAETYIINNNFENLEDVQRILDECGIDINQLPFDCNTNGTILYQIPANLNPQCFDTAFIDELSIIESPSYDNNIQSTPETNSESLPETVVIKPTAPPDKNNGNSSTAVNSDPITIITEETNAQKDTEVLSFAQQVVKLVNEERSKAGLSALSYDSKVEAAANVRAKETELSFSHSRPDGTSFSTALKEQNISFRMSGENIAYGQISAEDVMKGWMNSPGHRANILNGNYTSIGVGYYKAANGRNYWTQLFTS